MNIIVCDICRRCMLYDDYSDKPEAEYSAAVKAKLAELEPFWTKVIAIYATN